MQISENDWIKYKNKLASISDKAADEMVQWRQRKGGYQNISKEELIDYLRPLIKGEVKQIYKNGLPQHITRI